MSSQNKSFKEESIKSKILIVVVVSLLIIFALGFVIGLYYFGILGVFHLIGIQYNSFFSLFLFVIFYFLLGIFGEIILKIFTMLVSTIPLPPIVFGILSTLFAFLVTWAIISFLNFCMTSIDFRAETEILVAAIITIIESAIEQIDKDKDAHNSNHPKVHL